jgi:autotransporter strand-loop-strand O-heptosyltransferase
MQFETVEDVLINYNFISGAFIKLESMTSAVYTVTFKDGITGEVYYVTNIDGNSWCKCNVQFFVDWDITIHRDKEPFWHYKFNAQDKKVIIEIDTSALGDTIGWVPYIEEFRKEHKCITYASTYQFQYGNELFTNKYYPHLHFVEPGYTDVDIYAKYKLGCFYDKNDTTFNIDHHRSTFVGIPHQQIATDILGLKFKEIKPLIDETPRSPKKQVCIGMFSTSQAKFWNNPTGWQEVVDWLLEQGYEVKLLGREPDGYMGNRIPEGVTRVQSTNNINSAIEELRLSKAFIGIGSGLSWLAWATNTPMILISGFSDPITEMQSNCKRVRAPKNTCSGCYNRYLFNRGNWMWCPDQGFSIRQFECTRKITSRMVIARLEDMLK